MARFLVYSQQVCPPTLFRRRARFLAGTAHNLGASQTEWGGVALAALPVRGCAETSVATVLDLGGQRAISTKAGQTFNGSSIAVSLPFTFA